MKPMDPNGSISPSTQHSSFRVVPRTGVIFVTTEAQKLGFGGPSTADWCNLGQGMPECGPLPDAPGRVESIHLNDLSTHEYAPVAGVWELRAAVADMYNRRFRRGKKSQYTAENVAISSGGRVALTRMAAALGQINLGHFLPDYTAYEELLDIFRLFNPIPIALEADRRYALSPAELEREIVGRGLSALLMSNPCNPTGQILAGQALAEWVDLSRRLGCTLLMDEFYSHYIWNEFGPTFSAAEFVEDVERDPVVIFDGLTKNWRYSGWRIAWTVGPRAVIESVASAGSFLDGGGSRPLQLAALPLLEDEVIDAENAAIQKVFRRKRQIAIERCRAMGLILEHEPQGTFYVFANLSKLPPSLSNGMGFFQAALQNQVICVPGEFFDVNPGKRRRSPASRFSQHVRLSFGPAESILERGLERLEQMIHQTSD